jgi:uncharacterized membrane protein
MYKTLGNVLRHHRERLFLAAVLLVSSAAGLALLSFRLYYSGNVGYSFLAWNLVLAWIPLWLALAMTGLRRSGWQVGPAAWALGLLWLLFFPNAPYLLTEFIHLDPEYAVSLRPLRRLAGLSPARDVPVWFDAVLILMFAWNGLLLAIVSLHIVHRAVRSRMGAACGWSTVVLVLGLSGFGVSLGRFQRWNSWDLFFRPFTLLADVAGRLFNPFAHPKTTAVTVLFWSFLLLAYLSFVAMAALRSEGGPQRRLAS